MTTDRLMTAGEASPTGATRPREERSRKEKGENAIAGGEPTLMRTRA